MINKSTPVQVAAGVVSASAGGYHSLYVETDGTLWAMGNNSYGQLGDGTTTDRSTPVQVAGNMLSGAASKGYHSFMIQRRGVGTVPSITGQPQAQVKVLSDVLTMNVVVSGTGPIGYQWRKEGQSIPGMAARMATYYLPFTQQSDAGSYDVVVTNSAGTITSNSAVVSVFSAKENQTITFGELSNKFYGDAAFDLSATTDSGLTVSFSWVSGPATLSRNDAEGN